MSENDHARASITATVDEIVVGHAATGLPVEADEFLEAWVIMDRLERRYQEARAKAWADRWAKT